MESELVKTSGWVVAQPTPTAGSPPDPRRKGPDSPASTARDGTQIDPCEGVCQCRLMKPTP